MTTNLAKNFNQSGGLSIHALLNNDGQPRFEGGVMTQEQLLRARMLALGGRNNIFAEDENSSPHKKEKKREARVERLRGYEQAMASIASQKENTNLRLQELDENIAFLDQQHIETSRELEDLLQKGDALAQRLEQLFQRRTAMAEAHAETLAKIGHNNEIIERDEAENAARAEALRDVETIPATGPGTEKGDIVIHIMEDGTGELTPVIVNKESGVVKKCYDDMSPVERAALERDMGGNENLYVTENNTHSADAVAEAREDNKRLYAQLSEEEKALKIIGAEIVDVQSERAYLQKSIIEKRAELARITEERAAREAERAATQEYLEKLESAEDALEAGASPADIEAELTALESQRADLEQRFGSLDSARTLLGADGELSGSEIKQQMQTIDMAAAWENAQLGENQKYLSFTVEQLDATTAPLAEKWEAYKAAQGQDNVDPEVLRFQREELIRLNEERAFYQKIQDDILAGKTIDAAAIEQRMAESGRNNSWESFSTRYEGIASSIQSVANTVGTALEGTALGTMANVTGMIAGSAASMFAPEGNVGSAASGKTVSVFNGAANGQHVPTAAPANSPEAPAIATSRQQPAISGGLSL